VGAQESEGGVRELVLTEQMVRQADAAALKQVLIEAIDDGTTVFRLLGMASRWRCGCGMSMINAEWCVGGHYRGADPATDPQPLPENAA
jgi:CDGSH-type Zn-finger protein